MGRLLVEGALNRVYTLVLGKVIVYGALVLILNLCADVAALALDPRLRERAHIRSLGIVEKYC
jgi:oligopeptide transport system permease protein